MAGQLYGSGGAGLLTGQIDLITNNINAQFVTSAYNFNLTGHNTFSQVSAGTRVGSAVALTGKTVSEGVFNADDTVFQTIGGGATPPVIEGIVLYVDTGSENSSTLLAYYSAVGSFPLTTNGGDITIRWDATGIFTI